MKSEKLDLVRIVENQVRLRGDAGTWRMDVRAGAVASSLTGHRDREEEPHLVSSCFLANQVAIHGDDGD